MKNKLRVGALLLVLVMLCFAGCLGSSGEPGQSAPGGEAPGAADTPAPSVEINEDAIQLRLGGTVAETNPITQGLYYFADLVAQRSGGEIEVIVFPNLQLGGAREMMEAVQMGNLEMVESGTAAVSMFSDKMKFGSLPYLFPSREVAFQFYDSQVGQELTQRVADETDLLIISYFENGYYSTTNSLRPIRSPEDMRGMKLRVQENDIYLQTYSTLGANPMPMSFSEAYTAIQQGTIDGQQSNYVLTHTSLFYELLDHMTDTEFFYDITGVYINQDLFQSLSQEHQQILLECGHEAAVYQRDLALQSHEEAVEFLNGEMELTWLTDEERQAFIEQVQPVYDWFRDTIDDPYLDEYLSEIQRLSDG